MEPELAAILRGHGEKLDKLVRAMEGAPSEGNPGVLPRLGLTDKELGSAHRRINDVEDEQVETNRRIDKIVWLAAGAGLGGAAGGGGLVAWLSRL